MRTVSKALDILDLLGSSRAQLRSADVARQLGLDRSTCHRMLTVLAKHGYITKDGDTKKYALGPTVLRLSRAREAITPVLAVYDRILNRLTEELGETSHASLIAGTQIASVAACDGSRSNRVHHDVGVRLEWHATASGLACLAFSSSSLAGSVLPLELTRFTASTLLTRASVLEELNVIRSRGYSRVVGCFDTDVTGIAVPIFGADGLAKGAVSVVTPSSRITAELEGSIAMRVKAAALEATRYELGVPDERCLPDNAAHKQGTGTVTRVVKRASA